MRLPDWEPRLLAYLDEVADRGYAYGEHDCALFAAGGVLAMSGHDLAAPFRGRYATARGSVRALRRHGAGSLPETLTALLGPPQPLAWAHRGDLCLYGEAVGFLMPAYGLFVGRADNDSEIFGHGLVRVPRHLLDRERAWSVPFE